MPKITGNNIISEFQQWQQLTMLNIIHFQFNGVLLQDQYFLNEDVEVKNTGTYLEVKTDFGLVARFDGDRKLIVTLPDLYREKVIFHYFLFLQTQLSTTTQNSIRSKIIKSLQELMKLFLLYTCHRHLDINSLQTQCCQHSFRSHSLCMSFKLLVCLHGA